MTTRTNTSALVAMLALVGCQASPEQEAYTDEGKGTTIVSGGSVISQDDSEKLTIPINVEYGAFGLIGTAASAYTISLANCLSQYSATVTEANLDGVEVYKDDRNCLAKLTQFTSGGITYSATNPGATNFSTWLANDVALFTSAGGAVIRVKVVSQLSSPIAGTEAVVYNFSEILDGDGDYTYSEAEVSDAHLITVESQEAPHFDVVQATYMGMHDTSGAAQFKFKLQCVDDPTAATPTSIAMTDSGGVTNALCGTVNLSTVTYKLVKDTYSSAPSITDAETIFGTAGTSVTIPTDQYSSAPTAEGFNTVTLDGPGALGTVGNQNMILILKSGISYTYFNIDVTTITQ